MQPKLKTQDARNLMLACLGLLKEPKKKAKKADLLSAIRHIHVLQIDTISVVARAHLHILWSRLGAYDTAWVDELHAEGQLFEYFAHAMCYLPIDDYPLWRAVMKNRYTGWKRLKEWADKNADLLENVLSHIREHGEVRSADFESGGPESRWGTRKIEAMAMNHLHHTGDLMVARRVNFHRVFDLRERVHPAWNDEATPDYVQATGELALQAVKALGIAREEWVADYFYLPKRMVYDQLKTFVKDGSLQVLHVDGIAKPVYFHPDNLELFEKAQAGKLKSTRTTILSPFDPLMNNRARVRELFNFDYLIECYTPLAKRVYGYFTLPILHKGALVGRMDAKAWRKENRLQVIKLHLEPWVKPDSDLVNGLAKSLQNYASWQGLNTIEIDWASDEAFRQAIMAIS
ncbi:MAG: winged helix-turn-helix domain-containing protein [Chloroflexi bacterium]|nr:winged helix-turn-helix domain-containing protein [Chloroflexota bacterium]